MLSQQPKLKWSTLFGNDIHDSVVSGAIIYRRNGNYSVRVWSCDTVAQAKEIFRMWKEELHNG